MDRDAVLAARLATQRLTGPAASDPHQVVRELLCVQSQDGPIARAMVALRCGGTDADVQAAVARGELVRTHILRPTWHYVAAEDLRWLLALTSPKVESGMAARHRFLGLSEPCLGAAFDVLDAELNGRHFATRNELGAALAGAGLFTREDPLFGQQVGHVLLVAELRALVCSAPTDGADHRYALVDEVVAPTATLEREEALTQLVSRFVTGHGPIALADLTRWARVTLGEARTVVRGLDRLARVEVDGVELWHAPADALPEVRPQRAWLLSTFDEAFLSYRRVGWPRSAANPDGPDEARFAQSAGGAVLVDGQDVGGWKRRWERGAPRIDLALDPTLDAGMLRAVNEASNRLLAAIGA